MGLDRTDTTSGASHRVVWRFRKRYLGQRLREVLEAVTGGVLVLIGLAALAYLGNTGYLLVTAVTGHAHDLAHPSWTTLLINVRNSVLALITFVVCVVAGMNVMRGTRASVLFLRRFGDREATDVVSRAAARTIGRSWRMVTLDDAQVSPVGLPGVQSVLMSPTFGVEMRRLWGRSFRRLLYVVVAMSGAGYVVGLLLGRHGLEHAIDARHKRVIDALFSGHVPLETIDVSVAGLYAAVLLGCIALLLLPVLGLVALLVGGNMVFGFIVGSMREADALRRREVGESRELRGVAETLRDSAGKVFAPRLTVVRVAPAIWRQAVAQLSLASGVILIDISTATESLAWEIDLLARRGLRPRCVFVCRADRLAWLERASEGTFSDPRELRIAKLLKGQLVLAYAPDARGAKRFGRALRVALIEARRRQPSGR